MQFWLSLIQAKPRSGCPAAGLILLCILSAGAGSTYAQDSVPPIRPSVPPPNSAAVTVRGTEVFRVTADSDLLRLSERARLSAERLEALDPIAYDLELLQLNAITPTGPQPAEGMQAEDLLTTLSPREKRRVQQATAFDLRYDGTLIVRLLPDDAAAFQLTLVRYSTEVARAVEAYLSAEHARALSTPPVAEIEVVDVVNLGDLLRETFAQINGIAWARSIALTLLLIIVLAVTIWLIAKTFNLLYTRLEALKGSFQRSLRFRGVELIEAETLRGIFMTVLRGAHTIVLLLAVLVFSNYILDLFPEANELPVKAYIRGGIYALLISVLVWSAYNLNQRVLNWLLQSLREWRGSGLGDLKFQNFTVLSTDRSIDFVESALGVLRVLLNLVLAYLYLAAVFGLFQATQEWAERLFLYVANPLRGGFHSFINYLPNLFFIFVVILVTRYTIRALGIVSRETSRGRLRFAGFYPEWAAPTHRLVAFLLVIFAAIVAFPYLPGADSQAFQGISLFLGFMISLGSSAIIANIMAGVVVTYMRPFKVGDRVKIADTVGDVVEKTLLVTRIRTAKNVDVTIPNALALANHIINYSSSARDPGLILHTTITIGYDVPHQKVEELLLSVAAAVPDLRTDPAPFVHQTSLDDYYVSYELNAYTEHAGRMAGIYSEIHRQIQEHFHAAGVEIMSPHFFALRDGSSINIPTESPGSSSPFRVRLESNNAAAGSDTARETDGPRS